MEAAMQDDGDAQDRETAGLQNLLEHTMDRAAPIRAVSRDIKHRGTNARERAARAKERELAAHQRAIELHEQAAALQERLGHPDRAANAREHARHAQELLAKGRAEWGELEGERPGPTPEAGR
jgi:hypothetical protein